jgi:non-ribosomal peptide synthetase component E (peptide arylation enzyme)
MSNLGSLLLKRFAAFADTAALNDSGGSWRYRQLADAAIALERALCGAGLAPHEPVIVPVANEVRDSAALIRHMARGRRCGASGASRSSDRDRRRSRGD